jgi:hypothetical protein
MTNKQRILSLSVLLAIALCGGDATAGTLKTHSIFSSNMVVQRDKPITIWGWAEPGRKVSVQFGEAKAEATAGGEAGRWEVTFPARQANAAGQKLTVTSGEKTIEMGNILIGDVWVMNGQSNMAFPLAKTYESDMETATANLPLLRRVGIAPNESETLQVDIPADKIEGWTVSSPQTAGDFSAIGYTFASRLQRGLQIPVGIIDNARGGAAIESLVPHQKFKDHPLAARYLDSVDKRRAEFDWDAAVKSLVEKWEKDVAEKRKKGVPEDKLPSKPTRNDLRSWSVPGRSPSDADAFDNGMEFFSTFGGNTVSCAVGLAVLDVLRDEHLQSHALRVGARMLDGLRPLVERYGIVGDVRGSGLFLGVELVRDRVTGEPASEEASYVANRMREMGILLGTDGPYHNVVKIRPPMPFDEGDADRLVGCLERIVAEELS